MGGIRIHTGLTFTQDEGKHEMTSDLRETGDLMKSIISIIDSLTTQTKREVHLINQPMIKINNNKC